MQYDFLKQFPRRMKNVGLYALLLSNSGQKAIWKDCGFEEESVQLNMVFAVLLYIMEQSLKEESCTTDDISGYIADINQQYFRRDMPFEECKRLGAFIVNSVLSNDGKAMNFSGYDFEELSWQTIPISYVANKIIYIDDEVRRTSYYLTEDGYNLLLGTLEIESNMKLKVEELIFRLHLEKQSYDKALSDIRNIFNLMRIQIQKINEAIHVVKRNALNYNVSDYARLLREDLDTIENTKKDFQGYRETVRARVREINEADIDLNTLSKEDEEKLRSLKDIESWLSKAIDEHQRILGAHFDLKDMYAEELGRLSEMALVQRFDLRSALFDHIISDVSLLDRLDIFLHPLFNRDPIPSFNPEKAYDPQRTILAPDEDAEDENEDFDENAWLEEQRKARQEKLQKQVQSLDLILTSAIEKQQIKLSDLAVLTANDSEMMNELIPSISLFKELIIELIRCQKIHVDDLRHERETWLDNEFETFRITDIVLTAIDAHPEWPRVADIEIKRVPNAEPVTFHHVNDGTKTDARFRCSDVVIYLNGKE